MNIQISTTLLLFISWSFTAMATDPTTVNGNSEYYTIATASYVLNQVECHTELCYVTCETGCHSATINASLSQQLILDCSIEESCTELQITEGPQLQTSIACGLTSCHNAEFYLTTTPTIDLDCSGVNWGTVAGSACYELLFHAEDAQTVTINCNYNGCRSASFYVNNAHTVEINADTDGLHAASVFADNVQNALTVNCNLSRSCRYTSVHCPTSATCDILCPATESLSCEYLDVYITDNTYDYLTIDCDETSSSACSNLDIICESNAQSTLIKDGIWTCDSYHCCPLKEGTTTCPSGVDCVIECDRETCTNWVIDGSNAASLAVDCYTGSSGGCAGAIIKCPTTEMGSCSVLCEETDSCEYSVIQALGSNMDVLEVHCSMTSNCNYLYMDLAFDTLNVLNLTLLVSYGDRISVDHNATVQQFELNCKDCNSVDLYLSDIEIASAIVVCDNEDSCAGMQLDLTISNSIDFQCTELDACDGISVTVYAIGDVDMNIICDRACDGADFMVFSAVDMIQNASVSCGYYDCYSASFNFTNMTNVDVSCISSKSCRWMNLDALHAESLDLECGSIESCYSSDVYCPHQKVGACTITCDDASDSCDYMNIVVDDTYVANYLDLTCPSGSCSYFDIECNQVQNAFKYNVRLYYLYDNSTGITDYHCRVDHITSRYCCPSINTMAICEDKDCYINCYSANCREQTIDASNMDSLTIQCPDYMCNGTTIIAPVTTDIECGYKACHNMIIQESAHNIDLSLECYSDYACNSVEVIAPHAQNIGINCTDKEACYYMIVDATYSQSVAIQATGDTSEEGTWSHSTLYAMHASSVSIRCESFSSDRACVDDNYYIPDFGANTEITCVGLGCLSLGTIFVNTSVSQLSVEMCHYNYCGESESCADVWNIQCNAGTDVFKDMVQEQICSSSVCGCDTMMSAMSYKEVCASNVGVSSSKSYAVIPVIIASAIGGLVLILGIIGFVCLCCRKKRRRTTKIVENTIVIAPSQTDGDDPITGPTAKPSIQLVESNEPGTVLSVQPVTQSVFAIDPAIASLPKQIDVMAKAQTYGDEPATGGTTANPSVPLVESNEPGTVLTVQPVTQSSFAIDPAIASLPKQCDVMAKAVQPTASAPTVQVVEAPAAFMNEEEPAPAYDPSFNSAAADVMNEGEGNITHI